jgi:hypothetical protein
MRDWPVVRRMMAMRGLPAILGVPMMRGLLVMRNLPVMPSLWVMHVILVLPLLLLAATPARADWTPLSVKALGALCHATDATKHAECLGYVSGIYDLQFAPKVPAGVCPPANLDPELLAEVVTAYLDTHEDGPAAEAIGQSVVRFFPCGSGAPGGPKKP